MIAELAPTHLAHPTHAPFQDVASFDRVDDERFIVRADREIFRRELPFARGGKRRGS